MAGTVLVTGATGTLGREVVRLLVERGFSVRGLSRRERSGGGVAWVVGDLLTGAGVAEAVAGVEVVVDCATTIGSKDLVAVGMLLDAAKAAGEEPAGYAPDLGGPRVRTYRELAQVYLAAAGKRRLLLPLRLPGSVVRALRAGGNLTPEHADGRRAFEEALRPDVNQG